MIPRTLSAALAAFLLLSTPSAHAARDAASATAPGRVSPPKLTVWNDTLPAAERTRLERSVERIIARLLATPALTAPKGFGIEPSIVIGAPTTGMPDGTPATAKATLLLRQIDLKRSKGDAATGYVGTGEGPSVKIRVNDPSALSAQPVAVGEFFDMQTLPEERGGFPVLRFSMADHIIIAKPGRMPFRAVTKQEVLEKELTDLRETVAKLGEHAAPKLRAMLAGQEAELAALSTAERAAPACLGSSRKKGTFASCDDPRANRVVTLEPTYFDHSAGAGSTQLIILSVGIPNRDEHKVLGPVTRAAVDALDLDALKGSLE